MEPSQLIGPDGKVVPDCVADVFQDVSVRVVVGHAKRLAKECRELAEEMESLRGTHGESYPWCNFLWAKLDFLASAEKLESGAAEVRQGWPHSACPACRGRGCGNCRSVGYLTERQAEGRR